MKNIFLISLLTVFSLGGFCQNNEKSYDQALADSFGADDYGMKKLHIGYFKNRFQHERESANH